MESAAGQGHGWGHGAGSAWRQLRRARSKDGGSLKGPRTPSGRRTGRAARGERSRARAGLAGSSCHISARRCRRALRCAQAGRWPVGWDRQGVTRVTHPQLPGGGGGTLFPSSASPHSRVLLRRAPLQGSGSPQERGQGATRAWQGAPVTSAATKDPASAPAPTLGPAEPNALGKEFIEAAQNTATTSKHNRVTSKSASNSICWGRREFVRKQTAPPGTNTGSSIPPAQNHC